MDTAELRKLITNLGKRDMDSLERIYTEFKAPVYTIAYRITRERMAAEDITQEIFIRLITSPPDSTVLNPRAWIFRMTRNLAIDTVRKPKLDEPGEDIPCNEIPLDERISTRLDVERALKKLPQDECEIVVLHLNGGLVFREIADIIGKPIGTVLWLYRRALKALRDELSK